MSTAAMLILVSFILILEESTELHGVNAPMRMVQGNIRLDLFYIMRNSFNII